MEAASHEQVELKSLIHKRGQFKATLTRFTNFVKNFDANKNVTELKLRLQTINNLHAEFDNIQSKIEYLSDSVVDDDERIAFEDNFFKIISESQNLISKFSANSSSITSNSEVQPESSTQNAKLPILDLPKFYGEYTKWIQFRDNFTSLVHNDKSLSNVIKFHYLNSCLKGEAEQVLNSFEVTNENYPLAWNLLHERFENKKIIKRNHLKTLIEWPKITEKSHSKLRQLLEGIQLHLRALNSLGESTEYWDSIIIYIFTDKLDYTSNRQWNEFSANIESPTLDHFKSFLTNRYRFLEQENTSSNTSKFHYHNKHDTRNTNNKPYHSNQTLTHMSFNNIYCHLCKNNSHYIFNCQSFLNLPIKSRFDEITRLKLCKNCLRHKHDTEGCKSSSRCKICNYKHNTLLHFNKSQRNLQPEEASINVNSTQSNNSVDNVPSTSNTSITTHSSQPYNKRSEMLLSTALVNIKDKQGNIHECRVLLDSGSQSNFITKDLCDKLQLNKYGISFPITGINQNTIMISNRTNATIYSKCNNFNINLSFLVLDKITENLPISTIDIAQLQIPNNIILADPTFHTPNKIDLLVGASVFFDLLSIGQFKLGTQLPVLQKTKLGWILSGQAPLLLNNSNSNSNKSAVCNFSHDIEQQLEKFWRLENIDNKPQLSREEGECEDLFSKTTSRDNKGHFIVELPLRNNVNELGNTYQSALKRFHLLEKRFERNENLKTRYTDFINEYKQLGHMTLVNSQDNHNIKYYLPHHGVFKETSLTTKLRVVFDGSFQGNSGISLNDVLKVGPTIQDDLFSILLRFRKHNFVLVADIEKMYRQVFVHENYRDLQRILWRADPNHPIEHYQLNTVTYGTSSAPFLATRCLRQTGIDNQLSYPKASQAILKDFYVDDLLTGTSSIEEAKELVNNLIKILNSYGFPLRKWISNKREILSSIDQHTNQFSSHFICEDKVTKTLGIIWNSETDTFHYTIHSDTKVRVTKRTILSTISQIFDPLGLVGPVVVKAKVILQKLWQLKLGWDESIPTNLHTIWSQFYQQIQNLNHIKISRHVICFKPIFIQLHAFSDASEQAYGTCIYIRSTDSSENHFTNLITAKSRVAPLKNISLPRLELCGALLSAQLMDKILNSIDLKINEIYFWTDSTITLSWIAAESNNWKTFVANRVSEIQRLSNKCQWKHVSSNDNPADIISRGTDPNKLSNLTLWWHGPQWLSKHNMFWPKNIIQQINIPEQRTKIVTLSNQIQNQELFYKYSSFIKLQRVVAWCLRFKHNCCHSNEKRIGAISLSELQMGLETLLKIAQTQSFFQEIQSLTKSDSVSPKSKLVSLNPFLDDKGLIRVGGRLKNSNFSYNIKHPIVLPNHHPLTKLICQYEHCRHFHAGIQTTLYAVRTNYWPLNGRSVIRGIIRNCVTCFKANPSITSHQMGQLPHTRITPCRPFSIVGIDFAGPFNIKDGKTRNRKIIKCYICIFICFVTKAIHLELVSDLTSEAFLNSLKRFISRRGLCKTIYSDNATNFIGADNDLKALNKMLSNIGKTSIFQQFVQQNHIDWKFIPPRSPHFGGLWEAAVKSAKFHLKRILGNAHLTFEQFYTMLTQIEAILNSRPLTPLSNDPNDFLSLTPGHFLIGEPLTALPQEDVTHVPVNRLSHFKQIQQLTQHFWLRWSKEYLTSLQQRNKWQIQKPNGIASGAMVLLKEDSLPPLCWKMGRITEVFPGSDGIIRVVMVKTSAGVVKRAVSKICVLPIKT